MLDLYYWTTPNGHKVTMLLEEAGLPYRIVPVNIGRGEQFAPDFLRIAPNNRIPALVDGAPADGGDTDAAQRVIEAMQHNGGGHVARPTRLSRGS